MSDVCSASRRLAGLDSDTSCQLLLQQDFVCTEACNLRKACQVCHLCVGRSYVLTLHLAMLDIYITYHNASSLLCPVSAAIDSTPTDWIFACMCICI